MSGCAASSDRREPARRMVLPVPVSANLPANVPAVRSAILAVLLLAIVLASVLGGCASRKPPVPRAAPGPSEEAPPAVSLPPDGSTSSAVPYLPGTDRVYPSQEPRNQSRPDAPEAFPAVRRAAGGIESSESSAQASSAVELTAPSPPDSEAMRTAPSAVEPTAASPVEPTAPSSPASEETTASPAFPYGVQLAATRIQANAEGLALRAAKELPNVRVEREGPLFKVVCGASSRQEASRLLRRARAIGCRDAFLTTAGSGGSGPAGREPSKRDRVTRHGGTSRKDGAR